MKDSSSSDSLSPSNSWRVQGALILAQVFFGLGAVVGALGLPATHPLVFALAREFWAGLALLTLSVYYLHYQHQQQRQKHQDPANNHHHQDKKESTTFAASPSALLYATSAWRIHAKYFALLGFVVFGNQAGFIVGIKLAGAVTASVWQPCQPIFTAGICMAAGWEPVQAKRLAGIAVAFCGCVAMVLLKHKTNNLAINDTKSVSQQEPNNEATIHNAAGYLLGNALLFTNCLCTSLFVILSKRMLSLYPSLLVTAWSYNFATIYMAAAVLVASTMPTVQTLLCPDCIQGHADRSVWSIPTGALPALVYYVLFASVGSYGLLTWANQYATGTLVMSFTVLQPLTASLVTTALLVFGIAVSCSTTSSSHTADTAAVSSSSLCLDYPSMGTLCGMVGVLVGLVLIIATEATAKKKVKTISPETDIANQEMATLLVSSLSDIKEDD